MIAFPGMLASAAEEAGMKVPPDPDGEWDPEEFPHFTALCNYQIGKPMSNWNEHWTNAEVISKIPEEKLKKMTMKELIAELFTSRS